MTRTATAMDRVATCVVGMLAVALGVAAILWNLDAIKDFPARIEIPWLKILSITRGGHGLSELGEYC